MHHCEVKALSQGQGFRSESPTCPLQHSTKLLRDRSTSVLIQPVALHELPAAPFAAPAPASENWAQDFQSAFLTRGPPLV
jgi:hypothetical protein